jgi:hypothetical protein
MKTIQITITERNHHEGESFSYILEVSEIMADKIESFCTKSNIAGKIPASYRIDRDTKFTPELIDLLNKQANNGYMNRYDFYGLPKKIDFNDESLFYKSGVLIQISKLVKH